MLPSVPHARMINIVHVFSTLKLCIVQWVYVKTVHTCFKRQKLNCNNYLIAIITDLDFLLITFVVYIYTYINRIVRHHKKYKSTLSTCLLFSFVIPVKGAFATLAFYILLLSYYLYTATTKQNKHLPIVQK